MIDNLVEKIDNLEKNGGKTSRKSRFSQKKVFFLCKISTIVKFWSFGFWPKTPQLWNSQLWNLTVYILLFHDILFLLLSHSMSDYFPVYWLVLLTLFLYLWPAFQMRTKPADNNHRFDDPVIVYQIQLTDFLQLTDYWATI